MENISYKTTSFVVSATIILVMVLLGSIFIDALFFKWFSLRPAYVILIGLAFIMLSFWLKQEGKRKQGRDDSLHYKPCWYSALFFAFFGLGLYITIYSTFISKDFNNTLNLQENILITSEDTSEKSKSPSATETKTSRKKDNTPNETNEKSKDISTWATLLGIIVTIVTAYYFVALQGTWSQAKELLNKLENRENELRKLHAKITSVHENLSESSELFLVISKYIKDSQIIPKDERLNNYIEVLDKIIDIYNEIFVSGITNNREIDIAKIKKNIELLQQKAQESSAYSQYIPLGLLHQTKKYLDNLASHQLLSTKEINQVRNIKNLINQLEEKVKYDLVIVR